jgi:hypothetical protein
MIETSKKSKAAKQKSKGNGFADLRNNPDCLVFWVIFKDQLDENMEAKGKKTFYMKNWRRLRYMVDNPKGKWFGKIHNARVYSNDGTNQLLAIYCDIAMNGNEAGWNILV